LLNPSSRMMASYIRQTIPEMTTSVNRKAEQATGKQVALRFGNPTLSPMYGG